MNDDRIKEFWEELKTQRDELRVRMHLARADLKDEWEELEEKWESAQDRLEEVLDETGAAAREMRQTVRIIGQEIGEAYSRIKSRLEEDDAA